MNNPKMTYILEVYGEGEHGNQVSLAKWMTDNPFGAIAKGDTLDPSNWYNPIKDCIFRIASVEHRIYQIDADTGVETIHKVRLSCVKEAQQ